MSAYGSSFYGSSFYGETDGSPSWDLTTRLLMFVRGDHVGSTIASVIGDRGFAFANLCEALSQAFSLEGQGVILDRLGQIIQRPRPSGTNDADYSTLLKVQVNQILSSQAGIEVLLSIVREVTGLPSPGYWEFRPLEFQIECISDPVTTDLLVSLLRVARAGGSRMQVVESAPDTSHLIGDLVTDTYADPGVGDLVTDTYADAYVGVLVKE